MLYIDFDGVILDTWSVVCEKLLEEYKTLDLPESIKIKAVQEISWKYLLNTAPVINDSLYYLKNIDPSSSAILTKVHSLKEGDAKVIWLRENNISQNIILVPYTMHKAEIVPAKNNTLVDDCLQNLDTWALNGGIPIFFDMDNDNMDGWKQVNNNDYKRILSLNVCDAIDKVYDLKKDSKVHTSNGK